VNGAPGVEDVAFTQFEFAGGFHGQLASIWHRVAQRPSNRRLEIFCENLMLATDDDVGEIDLSPARRWRAGAHRTSGSDGALRRTSS